MQTFAVTTDTRRAFTRRASRALRLAHRWLGIAGALFFVMWFCSGLVMTQVGFPSLDDAERLHGLSLLEPDAVMTPPDEAMRVAGLHAFPRRMWLETLVHDDGRALPVWRMVTAEGVCHAVCAISGTRLAPVSAAHAEVIARVFSGVPSARSIDTVERDQWTVGAALDRQRPFHRIAVGDAAGTELYVSARSGEVVRDTSRRERTWNWLGAVPHWFYFTALREQSAVWRQALLWVSGLGCLSALSGLTLGLLHLRGRAPALPLRGWMKMHYVAGLAGGAFVLAWIASGWLSMSPGDWLRNTPPGKAAMARYAGSVAPAFPWPDDSRALTSLVGDARWKEAHLYWLDGHPRMTLVAADGHRQAFDMPGLGQPDVTEQHAETVAHALLPDARITAIERLAREDAYWYGRRDARELPVWRVKLEDDAATWLHIDALDGRLLGTLDREARLRRWLFNAPHSFELPALADAAALRHTLMWALALPGLAVAASAVVIGWRRLRARPR